MNNLEDFIRSNREDFDMASPDLKVWATINSSLEKSHRPRRVSLLRNFAIAASILFLIGLGTLIGMQINNGSTSPHTLGEVSLEYQELEQYYKSELKQKTALLASYENSDLSVGEDLQQLEGFLAELQTELQEAPKGKEEQIVNAMIENYRNRLEILERVLARLHFKSDKNLKSNDNEDITL